MNAFYENYLGLLHDLHEQIRAAIEGLPQEALDWVPLKDTNAIGAIIVHTAGAERFFLSDIVMQMSSNRDRDAEFRASGLDAATLIGKLTANEDYARTVLETLTMESLSEERFSSRHNRNVSVTWALLHILDHTGLHLGHIQLQRQMWDQR